LYHSLDEAERVYLHQTVGQVLEQLYQGQHEEVVGELARHFQMAGLVVQAVAYLQLAGDRAARLSAFQEAISHYSKALELLETLPDSAQYAHQELNLQLTLGRAQIIARGSGAPEVERAFSRARELGQQLEETRALSDALDGLITYYMIQGDIAQAYALAEQWLRLAQDLQDPSGGMMGAHLSLGTASLYRGELAQAQSHFEQGIDLYQPHQSTDLITGSSHLGDLGVFAQRQLATVKWLQGYPEQAVVLVRQAHTLAEDLDHPFSIAGALAITCLVHCCRREVPDVKDWAERTITLTTRHGIELWKLAGMMCHGWAMAKQGQAEEGIEEICHGLDAWSASGAQATLPLYLSLLAEAHMKISQVAEGLSVLEQALTGVEKSGERYWEAELHRLRGELLRIGGTDDAKIEQQFVKAIDVARRQGAKSWELRATVSLCRLWRAQGRREEARQMLAEIYGWFTEGFDTIDLKEAKVLLKELS
jgi:tetratricopeptide (TPR) repeat protein